MTPAHEDGPGTFGGDMIRRTVETFVLSFYNGEVKPNLCEKDPMTGRDVEFLMDAPQFDKVNRSEVWSYSTAVGTGYQYRVAYKDKRFSGLTQLLAMYSGSVHVADSDKPAVERRLYEMILLLVHEHRLPAGFKLQPPADTKESEAKVEGLRAEVSRLGQVIEALEKRIRALESSPEPEEPQPAEFPTAPVVSPPPERAPWVPATPDAGSANQ